MNILEGIKEFFEIMYYFFKYGEKEGQIKWRLKKLEEREKNED